MKYYIQGFVLLPFFFLICELFFLFLFFLKRLAKRGQLALLQSNTGEL